MCSDSLAVHGSDMGHGTSRIHGARETQACGPSMALLKHLTQNESLKQKIAHS